MRVGTYRYKVRPNCGGTLMSKISQQCIVLLSLGLASLLPFWVGCNGCSPEQPPMVAPVESTETAEPIETTIDTPEPPTPMEPVEMPTEPEFVPTPVALPEPESVAEPPAIVAQPETPDAPPVADPPAPAPSVIEEKDEPKEEKTTEGIRTDSPVDQTPPVNLTPPVDTESPVNTESPVQSGNFTRQQPRTIPASLTTLHDEQPASTQPVPIQSVPAELAEIELEKPEAPIQPATVPVVVESPQQSAVPAVVDVPQTETPQTGVQSEMQSVPFAPSPASPGTSGQMPRGRQGAGGRTEGGSGGRFGGQPQQQSVVQVPREVPAGMLRFSFRNTPWKDVIEWFADQAALSLQADKMPTGTLNYTDIGYYTPTESLDILNAYLQFKDYSLVRKGKTLFILYLPDGIPPNLLDTITPEELDDRGKYEICRVVFNLTRTPPAAVQNEIERLLGPQGAILLMPMSQQIAVTETGGTLRTIREIIRRIDDPEEIGDGTFHSVEMKSLTADEALQTLRQLLGSDANDASLRMAVDSTGKRIYLSGRADLIRRAKDLLTRIDATYAENNPDMWGEPQFETYEVGFADPATVYSVLQTILVGTPDVRLSLDPKTNGILLRARPAVHATVKESIKQMQLNAPQIDIIPLKRMSPQTAVDRIKMFIPTAPALSATTPATGGRDGGGRQQQTTSATQLPTVEPDTMARQIIVRGTLSQIKEIRDFLISQGEDGNVAAVSVDRSRVIPLSPAATALVMEHLREILPVLGPNINIIAPALEQPPVIEEEPAVVQEPEIEEPKMQELAIPYDELIRELEQELENRIQNNNRTRSIDEIIDSIFDKELPITRLQQIAEQPILAQVAEPATKPSDVKLTLTPVGIVVSSDDPEALAKVEELIRMLSDEEFLSPLIFKEYYLTHASASVVSSELQSLLNSSASSGAGVSGMATMNLPEWQEPELAGLLAMSHGNAIEKTGTVTISTNDRLNSLWIQANRIDHKTIERLIKILDQPSREDVARNPVPRSIKLNYMKASEARTLVEQAFANQMRSAQQNQQRGGQQMPQMRIQGGEGMEQMMQAFQQVAAQQGGGRGGANQQREQEQPMTLAVDSAANELIVTSTESVFIGVEKFVRERDELAGQQKTVMVTQKLINVTPSVLQPSLSGFLGDSVRFGNIQVPSGRGMQQGGFGGAGTMGGLGNIGGIGGSTMVGGVIGGQQRQMGGGTIGAGAMGDGARPAGTFGGGTIGDGARPAGTMSGGTIGGGARPTGSTIGGGAGGARPAGR